MALEINRRSLLKAAGAGAALLPAHQLLAQSGGIDFSLADERFWEKVKQAFMLNPSVTYMNVGTTGSMPTHVMEAYDADNKLIAANPREKLGNDSFRLELVRERLAASFGCGQDEIVASGNTTNGLTQTLNGLTLESGDVILTTEHEHPGLLSPLQLLEDRRGVQVIKIPLPVGEDQQPEDYLDRFERALLAYQGRIKLVAFSAPTFTTGTMLPVRAIVDLLITFYHQYGWETHTLVDGAHASGMFNLDFNALGADFFCCSGHKWQCAPGGTGIWYIRNKVDDNNPIPLPRFYPTDTDYYRADRTPPAPDGERGDYNIGDFVQAHGNANFPAATALANVCDFWQRIGRDRIENYIVQDLAGSMKQKIIDHWGVESLYSPSGNPELLSALTTFTPFVDNRSDKDASDLFVSKLYEDYGFIVRNTVTPVLQSDGSLVEEYPIRISTHLFHGQQDVNGLYDAMADLSQKFGSGFVSGKATIFSQENDG